MRDIYYINFVVDGDCYITIWQTIAFKSFQLHTHILLIKKKKDTMWHWKGCHRQPRAWMSVRKYSMCVFRSLCCLEKNQLQMMQHPERSSSLLLNKSPQTLLYHPNGCNRSAASAAPPLEHPCHLCVNWSDLWYKLIIYPIFSESHSQTASPQCWPRHCAN